MTLSELFELSPLGYELFKSEMIRLFGHCPWEICSTINVELKNCFEFKQSDYAEIWHQLQYDNATTLLRQWEAKQTVSIK